MPNKTKCVVVDTNVLITANLSSDPASVDDDLVQCVGRCVEAIELIQRNRSLVLDCGGEILCEYQKYFSFSGRPGVGDAFFKWVHDNQWRLERVEITPHGASYAEFPAHPGLTLFDRSDRKFVAVANAHPDKPPILQARDSKWIGWERALSDVGLAVVFLCREYARAKYRKKMEA